MARSPCKICIISRYSSLLSYEYMELDESVSGKYFIQNWFRYEIHIYYYESLESICVSRANHHQFACKYISTSNFEPFASNRFRDDVSFKGSLVFFQTLTTAILMIWSKYFGMDEIAIHLQKIGNAMAHTLAHCYYEFMWKMYSFIPYSIDFSLPPNLVANNSVRIIHAKHIYHFA